MTLAFVGFLSLVGFLNLLDFRIPIPIKPQFYNHCVDVAAGCLSLDITSSDNINFVLEKINSIHLILITSVKSLQRSVIAGFCLIPLSAGLNMGVLEVTSNELKNSIIYRCWPQSQYSVKPFTR